MIVCVCVCERERERETRLGVGEEDVVQALDPHPIKRRLAQPATNNDILVNLSVNLLRMGIDISQLSANESSLPRTNMVLSACCRLVQVNLLRMSIDI